MHYMLLTLGILFFIVSPFMKNSSTIKDGDRVFAILAISTILTGIFIAIGNDLVFNYIFYFFIIVGLIISPFYYIASNNRKHRMIISGTALFSLIFTLFILYPLKYNEDMINSNKIYKVITYKKHFNHLKSVVEDTINCRCLKKTLWNSKSYYIILLSVIDMKK